MGNGGRRVLRTALTPVLGKRQLQGFFERLNQFALVGLNVGQGAEPEASGETYVLRLLKNSVRTAATPLVVFDVGANIGAYTTAALRALGAGCRIEAFEPSISAYGRLARSVEDLENVRVHRLALARTDGEGELIAPVSGSKAGSLYDRSTRLGLKEAHHEFVPMTTLDHWCLEEGIANIDLLKLDVEGAELDVLRGSEELLRTGSIQHIQWEFGAANIQSRTYFKDFFELLAHSYDLFRILQNGLSPITRYDERHEVFTRATNFLAIHRNAEPGSR